MCARGANTMGVLQERSAGSANKSIAFRMKKNVYFGEECAAETFRSKYNIIAVLKRKKKTSEDIQRRLVLAAGRTIRTAEAAVVRIFSRRSSTCLYKI